MELNDLEIYRLSREISKEAWSIYNNLDWQDKKVMGDQFISAIDSVGANIAEGFGRFHYLDKNKFNYNSRGSLLESFHWLAILEERGKMDKDFYNLLYLKLEKLHKKLNSFISTTKRQTNNF
ncbi:four helix bundle protein [Candidatus Wolfebacteria bacterium]|nr:four helix bundle protein [Candidatus Wolfebacteria bacterium]